MSRVILALSAAALLTAVACREYAREDGQIDPKELAKREALFSDARALPAQPAESVAAGKPLARWTLPATLTEISGLALTDDGRLFAHGDEIGQISELDYRRGVLVKQFTLGRSQLNGDFEGLTWADGMFYLLASNGKIYEFREGENREKVRYVVHDTHLGKECEFEGITWDAERGSLLLACKKVEKNRFANDLVIYSWKLPEGPVPTAPEITIPRRDVIGQNPWKNLHPSDITRDPLTGNFVLVTAQEEAMIIVTPDGAPVLSRPLPTGLAHTEGVAITKDSLLLLSDEAGKQPASLSVYHWP